jgi:predicted DNA repair protein MutK
MLYVGNAQFHIDHDTKKNIMAGSSLLTLIDDIATLLDDISIMTKVAAKKTAGVLGDDLALNAQQVSGVSADRELPVVWAVAKGSFINKVILVPTALLISTFAPWAIIPLLMLGGAFLCFEGFEKIAHKLLHSAREDDAHHEELKQAAANPALDIVHFEKDKVRGAVRTDFILSAEIIVITLGAVAAATLTQQILVLSVIAIAMTVGVYGLVAGIVKLDDVGIYLSRKQDSLRKSLGHFLLAAAPKLMKSLSILGTAAMFLVGGGILSHGIPFLHHVSEQLANLANLAGHIPALAATLLFDALVGIVAGAVIVAVVTLLKKMFGKTVG